MSRDKSSSTTDELLIKLIDNLNQYHAQGIAHGGVSAKNIERTAGELSAPTARHIFSDTYKKAEWGPIDDIKAMQKLLVMEASDGLFMYEYSKEKKSLLAAEIPEGHKARKTELSESDVKLLNVFRAYEWATEEKSAEEQHARACSIRYAMDTLLGSDLLTKEMVEDTCMRMYADASRAVDESEVMLEMDEEKGEESSSRPSWTTTSTDEKPKNYDMPRHDIGKLGLVQALYGKIVDAIKDHDQHEAELVTYKSFCEKDYEEHPPGWDDEGQFANVNISLMEEQIERIINTILPPDDPVVTDNSQTIAKFDINITPPEESKGLGRG